MNEVRVKECWNGSAIVTHEKIDGKWVATGIKCPPEPPTPLTPL